LDGIPKHLPALLRAEKLVKKARKAGLIDRKDRGSLRKQIIARSLYDLTAIAQRKGWSAEELLREEIQRQEKALRRKETGKNDA
jgi:nucleoside triphosphate diphosphatase